MRALFEASLRFTAPVALALFLWPSSGRGATDSTPADAATPAQTYAHLKDGTKVPLFTAQYDSTPVARVGPAVVTLGDLTAALAAMHQQHGKFKAAGKDFSAVLDRLVNAHVVALEAASMGITEMPEFKTKVDAFREKAMREALRRDVTRGARASSRDVERAARTALREWKVRSALFEKQEDAKRFHATLKAGGSFEALLVRAVAGGKAKGGLRPELVRETLLALPVRDALRKLKVGAVSPPIQVPGGYTVVQCLGRRQGGSPEERAQVEAQADAAARVDALRAYYEKLVEKYAQVDRRLLEKLDLEAEKPGLDALDKDSRPLARIRGEPPLTIADLVAELRKKYFHGIERLAKEHKLNARKEPAFDDMLEKRLFVKEARAQDLQNRDDVKRQVAEFSDQLALAAAVERAVAPEVKVTEDDVRKYYDVHRSEFTSPAMIQLEGLAFERAADAQDTLRKLRAGTDFKWLAANAQGQIDPPKRTLQVQGSTFVMSDLEPGLAKALADARTGDCRLYADPGGAQYVVHVIELLPPEVQPYESVKQGLWRTVYGEKLNAAFAAWAAALRQHYPVEVLIAKLGD